jgi:hypothetical protein
MTSEEKERRRKEFFDISEKRRVLIERAVAAGNSGDREGAKKLYEEMLSLVPELCEHGHHWASMCMACDNIHKEVFPELYKQCSSCGELVDPDELDKKKRCFNCQGE